MAALTAAEYRAFVQRTPGPHGIHFDLLRFSRDCNPKDVQAQGEANGFGPVWRASVHMSFFPECVMVLRSVQPGTGTGPRPLEGNRSALVKADLMRAFVPAVQALLQHTLVMPPSPLEAVPGAPFLTFPQAFTLVKGNMETCADDLTHAVFAAALWKTRRATLESWSDGNMDKWLTHALQRDVATTAMRQRPRTVGQDLCDGVATLRNELLNAAFLVYVSMGCRRQWRAVMAGVEDVLPHMGAVVAAFGDPACAFHAPASFVHRAEAVLARAWDAWALHTPRFVYDGIGAAVMRASVADTASPGGLAWVLVAAYVVAQRLDQAQVQGLCAEAAADGWSAVRLPAIALAAPAPAPALPLPSPPFLVSKADTAAAVAATAACTEFDTSSCCPPGLCALQDLLVLAPRRCEGGPKFIVDGAGSLDVGGFGVRLPPAPYEDLVFLAESAVPVYMSVEVAKTKKDPKRVGKCSVLDADVARVKAFAQPDRVFAMLDGAYSAPLADTVASARAFAAAAVFMGPAMDDVWNLSPGCVPHRELQAVLVKELQESGLVHTPCTLSTSWSANASSALWWWMFKRTSLCSGADVEEPADALARGCVRTCLACCCELAARAPALGPLLQWGAFVRLWRRARQQAPRTHLPDDPCTAEVFIKIETADTVSVHDVEDVPELLPEYQHVLAVQAVHDCLFEGAVSRQSAPFVDEDVTQACVQRLVFRGDWTTTAARDAFCALVRKGGGGGGVAAEGVWTGPHCKASSWDSPALLPFQRPGDLGTDVLSRTQAHALDMAATCDSRSAVGTVLFAHPVAMVSSLIARFAALVKSAKSRS